MPVSDDQRRVLAMLSAAGPDGVAQAILSASGFDASMIAGLVNRAGDSHDRKGFGGRKAERGRHSENHGSWTPCSRY